MTGALGPSGPAGQAGPAGAQGPPGIQGAPGGGVRLVYYRDSSSPIDDGGASAFFTLHVQVDAGDSAEAPTVARFSLSNKLSTAVIRFDGAGISSDCNTDTCGQAVTSANYALHAFLVADGGSPQSLGGVMHCNQIGFDPICADGFSFVATVPGAALPAGDYQVYLTLGDACSTLGGACVEPASADWVIGPAVLTVEQYP